MDFRLQAEGFHPAGGMSSELRRFADLMRCEPFDLAEACLLIGLDAEPRLDVRVELARLDAMAATVRERIGADASAEQKVVALNHYLFSELGFRGNIDDYYDPRNSYLHEVMRRRTGIPITLSIVYLEVGRRLGLPLEGVSFPGHFLVKLAVRGGELVLDPFSGGEPQSASGLRRRLAQVLPSRLIEDTDLDVYLEAASPREIVARLLRNLKSIHCRAGQLSEALAVMNRMLLVLPDSPEMQRDRGLLYAQMEASRAALADLREYLKRRVDAPDAADIREKVVELEVACARLN
jgi:regulator of sirC expression with transglutaminase-like and TPR domain